MQTPDLSLLKRTELFSGLEETEISSMLGCLSARRKTYPRGSLVLEAGSAVRAVGVVLSGRVSVVKEDAWGNRNILAAIEPGMSFAESYACSAGTPLAVSIEAEADSEVLWLDVRRILTVCSSACGFHSRLIRNLVGLLASRNLMMNEKLTFLTRRSTREKLLSYFSAESLRHGSLSFDIPFDRQELADYLSVDRSAMSAELSRLRGDGVLQYRKNHFTLLERPEES